MSRNSIYSVVSFSLLILVTTLQAVEYSDTTIPMLSAQKIVKEIYPNVKMGFLIDAVVSELPEGILLKADDVVIESKELNETIADANEQIRPMLTKYASLVLEQISISPLFALDIQNEAAKNGKEIIENDDNTIIKNYITTLSKTVTVSDAEILEFYNANKDSLSDATMAQIRPQIHQYLVQEKLQKLLDEKADTIGQRMKIEISASWLKAQVVLEKDNPVNKARDSGRPTLVDFGSKGCIPCDMLAPILTTLQEKYKEKANVVVVQTSEEPILTSRYGVEVIPLQIFFDKTGKEVFRHVGFFSQEEIEKKLAEMDVK